MESYTKDQKKSLYRHCALTQNSLKSVFLAVRSLSTQKRYTCMAQTVAPSGHHCCGPGTAFVFSIPSKFDVIIQVSLSLGVSSLQVKFLGHFTLSGIEKTLLIMVGKCQGYIINVLPNKVWSCHFGNIQVSLSSMGVLSGTWIYRSELQLWQKLDMSTCLSACSTTNAAKNGNCLVRF